MRGGNISLYTAMAFLAAWVVVAIYDANLRAEQTMKAQDFIAAGARFTADDGKAISDRIDALESRLKALEAFCR